MEPSTGLVGVPCAVHSRWSSFHASLVGLTLPPGWRVLYGVGQSPAANRNGIIRTALHEGRDWVFFLDDDLSFPPSLLTTLLETGKKAVVALSFRRVDPFGPIWFHRCAPEESAFLRRGDLPPRGEIIPLAAATLGGLLLHTSIFREMDDPWFTLGQFYKDQWNDDLDFFRRMPGQLYGATGAICGHTADMEVWPHYGPEGWQVALAKNQQVFAALPAESKESVCEPEPLPV